MAWQLAVISFAAFLAFALNALVSMTNRIRWLERKVFEQSMRIEQNQNYKDLYEKEHKEYRMYVENAVSQRQLIAEKDAVISDLQAQLDDYY